MHLKWQISRRLETFTAIKSDNISSSQVCLLGAEWCSGDHLARNNQGMLLCL